MACRRNIGRGLCEADKSPKKEPATYYPILRHRMLVLAEPNIYHTVHVDRLVSIVRDGILWFAGKIQNHRELDHSTSRALPRLLNQ